MPSPRKCLLHRLYVTIIARRVELREKSKVLTNDRALGCIEKMETVVDCS